MRRLLLLLLFLPVLAWAAPDRAGLIAAWESAMRRDGALDAQADGGYRYRSDAIGYDGAVKITSAIVRNDGFDDIGQAGAGTMGTVDFDLVDRPAESKDSMSTGLMMWKAEHQSFIYDDPRQAWQSTTDWARSHYGDRGGAGRPFVLLRWLMDYAIPVGLFAFFIALFWWFSRVQRQSGSTMKDASDINRMARENVERAAQLQEEQKARMDESIALARRNTALLESILEELRKRP